MAGQRGRPKKGQRSDGLIAVYATYGRDAGGKRIRKVFYGHTQEEARQKQAQYEHRQLLDIDTGRMTVAEWCDTWLNTYKPNLSGTNRVTYLSCMERLKRDLGGLLLTNVRQVHLQRSLNQMDGMSASAISKYKMVLSQIFRRAWQNHLIPDDPSVDLESPEGTSGKHRALERWEAEFIAQHWPEHRAGLWVMIMMLAGLRRGEMIALQWDSVDLRERVIRVHQSAEIVSNQPIVKQWTKTDAGMRSVPICDALTEALSFVPPEKREGHVCLSAHGTPISQAAFNHGMDGFNAAMERILNGEPVDRQGHRTDLQPDAPGRIRFSVRAHDLRYTFATLLYDAGVDVKSAQYFLGHADVRMTMNLYTQLSKERETEARERAISYLDTWLLHPDQKTPKPD